MNIRERWLGVKDSLACELYRLNEMVRSEAKHSIHDGFTAAGQKIELSRVVEALGIKSLIGRNHDVIVSVPSQGYGYNTWGNVSGDMEFWRDQLQKDHFPMTLREADALLSAMAELTNERIHHAIDAALLAVS